MQFLKEKEFCEFLTTSGEYSCFNNVANEEYEAISTDSNVCKSLDLFCPDCKADKTFIRKNQSSISWLGSFQMHTPFNGIRTNNNLVNLLYECPTCKKRLLYTVLLQNESVIKLAQYPSLYDVSRDELKKYQKNKLIDKDSFREIYKAETCASSGYYVAAYTYMRRVYETMLMSVFTDNQEAIGLSDDEFRKLYSDKKLEAIKDYLAIDDEIYLPLYGLLSAGIHAMTEEQCCEDYVVLKPILLEILAEQKAKQEKADKRKELKELFAKRKGEMK